MQKMAGSYLVKKLGDELFAKPARATAVEAEEGENGAPDLHGQIIQDDDGQDVGRARRMPGVAVYVVMDGPGRADEVLARCLGDPGSRVLFQEEGGRITAVIYVPDPTWAPRRGEGLRADEV